jgi:hypothetical protein
MVRRSFSAGMICSGFAARVQEFSAEYQRNRPGLTFEIGKKNRNPQGRIFLLYRILEHWLPLATSSMV